MAAKSNRSSLLMLAVYSLNFTILFGVVVVFLSQLKRTKAIEEYVKKKERERD